MAVTRIKAPVRSEHSPTERIATLEAETATLKAMMAAAIRKGVLTAAEIDAEKRRTPAV
ncbi:hypothetical protein [Albidovulum sp.]